MTGICPNKTVTIETISEPRSWERELWHRSAQGMEPPADVPAVDEESEHHGSNIIPGEDQDNA